MQQGFDSVSINRDSGACVLTLLDHLPWDAQHLFDLQQRINLCLRTIESGELFLSHPAAAESEFTIELRCIYAPDSEAHAFLAQAREVLDDAGYQLRFGPLGSAYADEAADDSL